MNNLQKNLDDFLKRIEAIKNKTVRNQETLIKKINVKNRTADFTATREVKDRQGDIVKVNGIDTTNFEKNPIILFAHDYSTLPVGRAVSISKSGTELNITVEFASAEMNPQAEQVWQMVKAGYLQAVSIGFIPQKTFFDETLSAFIIEKSELLEVSVVPVPANQEALRRAISKDFLENVDKKDGRLYQEHKSTEETTAVQNKEALKNYRKHQVELRELIGKDATEDEIETTDIVFGAVKDIISFTQKTLKTSQENPVEEVKEPEPEETPQEGFEKALKEIFGK